MNNTKAKNIKWKIRGPNWVFRFEASEDSDPMDLFTYCLEHIWGEVEDWKLSSSHTNPPINASLKTKNQEEPKLSVLLVLENSNMSTKEEHLVVSTPLVLANAGMYNEATRLEKSWDLTPEEMRVKTIIAILEQY